MTTFADIPQFPKAHYEINVPWDYLEGWLKDHQKEHAKLYDLDLNPDYQRIHVWTPEQQTAYVEFILQGGESGKVLYWNHPNWGRSYKGVLELVDGKQRLEAVRAFLRSEVRAFGHLYAEYTDRLSISAADFRMRIAALPTRKMVLQWYLLINAGGTPHTKEELDRVRGLLTKGC